jgi:ABC-2 type transport system permease protein
MTAISPFASGRLPRIIAMETKAEFLKVVRLPAYVIPVIAFPALFYLVFGLAFGGAPSPSGGALTMSGYMVATYGTFGVVGAALFGLGIGVATERAWCSPPSSR